MLFFGLKQDLRSSPLCSTVFKIGGYMPENQSFSQHLIHDTIDPECLFTYLIFFYYACSQSLRGLIGIAVGKLMLLSWERLFWVLDLQFLQLSWICLSPNMIEVAVEIKLLSMIISSSKLFKVLTKFSGLSIFGHSWIQGPCKSINNYTVGCIQFILHHLVNYIISITRMLRICNKSGLINGHIIA